jgi:VIT1/CCC1 family predicted Fe2+/Mn2+ transporter
MDLLLTFLVYFLAFGLVAWLVSASPFDDRVKQMAWFVLAVIAVVLVIRLLLGGGMIVVR